MCHSTCRDHRPPPQGTARAVAIELDRQSIEPATMVRWLRAFFGVERFRDLCYSHATAVEDGLRRSILADMIREHE